MNLHTNLGIFDVDLEEMVSARCQSHSGGHLLTVELDPGLTVQTSGDGIGRMLELLDVCRRKVESAHRDWLRQCVAEGQAS